MQLAVGRVGRAHGIHGWVSVEVRTDDPEVRFADGAALVTDPPERGPLAVAATRWHSGRLLVRFTGVDDRSAAEALRGTLLTVDSADLPDLDDPEEFHDHQLVGLAALTVTGEPVGEVVDVVHLPAQDCLVVRREPAGDEVLVPFVAAIVPTVDLAAGRVLLDPPGGLLDDRA